MNYFSRRNIRSHLKRLLKEARHVRNLREDVADPNDLRLLDESEQKVRDALADRDWKKMESAGEEFQCNIQNFVPEKTYSWLRENIEIIVVAIAVAMAFRTFFVQPFKIPTSSMSPSLYGIHYVSKSKPDWSDRFPLNVIKWAVLGEWYIDVRAKTSGMARFIEKKPGSWTIDINGISHPIFDLAQHVSPGDRVFKGQLLASGLRIAGDHILVNKISWHFLKPKRGEIMVFKTNGIDNPQIEKKAHYVKRLVGLPYETLSIDEPFLKINGQNISSKPASIARIQDKKPGYSGYRMAGSYLESVNNTVRLEQGQYFACGDNQASSLDSRYWGPVPHQNLVGPAFFVYWPFSCHWGITRK